MRNIRSKSYAGVDIAVKTSATGETDAGTLEPGSGLQNSNGELTHTQSKNYSGSAQFTFTWTAPMVAGTYFLRAAGNAGNHDGSSSGVQWNIMPRG